MNEGAATRDYPRQKWQQVKTYLQSRISDLLPQEELVSVTSLSENTLYYSPKGYFSHKVLLIEDLDGTYAALYPLRELMTKGSLSKLTTDKDKKGNNAQRKLHVEGPVCVSGATTSAEIYEDNANRSYAIEVDESRKHAEAVMDYQREEKAGEVDKSVQEGARKALAKCPAHVAARLRDQPLRQVAQNPRCGLQTAPHEYALPAPNREHHALPPVPADMEKGQDGGELYRDQPGRHRLGQLAGQREPFAQK